MTVKTELRKALTSTGAGAALLPYDLDPVLNEELLKLQPLAQLLELEPAGAKTHEYSIRTSHPSGWFEGETSNATNQNSVYVRKTVQCKINRIWGSVSGFAQSFDEPFVDALTTELEGSLEGMSNVLEYGTIWGCADDIGYTGDPYQFSGIFPRVAKLAPANIIDGGSAKISLDMMDQAIAISTGFRGLAADPKLFMLGYRMRQVIDGLQTRVTIPLTDAILKEGRITMRAYAGIPLMESDYVTALGTSPSDMAGVGAVGGSLTASTTYYYRIASVTMAGEQVSSADVTAATTAGQGKINFTWTADPLAKLYMIFKKVGGIMNLLDIIPALTYDANGNTNGSVNTWTDDGTKTSTAVKPLQAGEQNIFLMNLNPRRGLAYVGKVDDMGRQMDRMFNFVELARVKDTYDYMLKNYIAPRLKYPNLVSVIRHVKTT